MKKKWHETKMGNDHQGLIIDENGKNIAVSYDKADARLIAAAPEMLDLCREIRKELDAPCIPTVWMKDALDRLIYEIEAAQ